MASRSLDADVPDPTDWLPTPLSGLAGVETALQCKVCKEPYKTPMLTSCSHTFCSECIRRALGNDGKCPLCRSSDQESKLRNNWSMEEAVEAFAQARAGALAFATLGGASGRMSPKRKAEESDQFEAEIEPRSKRLRSSARLSKSRLERDSPVKLPDDVEVVDVTDDEDYSETMPDDGLVPCPLCHTRMREALVFSHLDTCTGQTPQSSTRSRQAPAPPTRTLFGHQNEDRHRENKPPDRLPALNYSMMKEQALRKKMSELGLSNFGSRALLEKRHKEWVTIWNANCDSTRPRKRRELLHDLDVWERTQGGHAQPSSRASCATAVKDKEFDGDAWAVKHQASFADLIASARRSRSQVAAKAETRLAPVEPTESAGTPLPQYDPATIPMISDTRPQELAATSADYISKPSAEQGLTGTNLGTEPTAEQNARNWPDAPLAMP